MHKKRINIILFLWWWWLRIFCCRLLLRWTRENCAHRKQLDNRRRSQEAANGSFQVFKRQYISSGLWINDGGRHFTVVVMEHARILQTFQDVGILTFPLTCPAKVHRELKNNNSLLYHIPSMVGWIFGKENVETGDVPMLKPPLS